ncbi:MAG TPA: SpoIIE family protein phosphatase [Pyrinomonadaceae bacterium]|jgi:sigma-B regulation protein RsbU (phosphoserine phosphatase)
MGGRWQSASDGFAERLARAREWFRRAMPRLAAAAGALFLLRLFVRDTSLYRETPFGLLGPLTFFACAAVLLYYGLKLLVRLKRRLLWRVRRRLIITYLFVGLTPVVLLLALGALAAAGGSSQAMARVVRVQVDATERQALEGARSLADGLLALPPESNARAAQAWLDERAALLRSALPGARVYVWRGGVGPRAAWLGQEEPAHLVSARADEETRGVGFDDAGARETLPAWLAGAHEWSGVAYAPPPDGSQTSFGTPSVRALVRVSGGGRPVAVLLSVPVSRALVARYRETTGVHLRPFFLGARGREEQRQGGRVTFRFGDPELDREIENDVSGRVGKVVDFSRDQFGENMPQLTGFNFPYPVILDSTDWGTGVESQGWAFVVFWSWDEGVKQVWGDAELSRRLWQAFYFVAVAFLLLELAALFSAAWMTRAVTGAVHKLYRATESVKRGDFSHRIRTRSRDQLGELALAFNDMSSNIETLLAERVEHERLKREVEIAHEVQAQLFPRSTPALASAAMTGECRAALGVAGDYYDFVEVAPGLVALALGDVSGKGLSASLVMSNLQAALRAQAAIISERLRAAGQAQPAAAAAGGDGVQPAGPSGGGGDAARAVSDMTASINGQLCRSTDADRFATLFLALYDDRALSLRYTNAGHNAPLLVRAGGGVERLWAGGTVLGAFDFAPFEEGQAQLSAGDLLVIYSDGITEAQNAGGEEYGEERLARLAAERRHETAENIRAAIFEDVERWTAQAERGDDQTLVILKCREP